MSADIRVHVVDYGRKSLYMRYRDPVSGQQVTRSTGTNRKREAERIAAKWEDALREGRFKAKSRTRWEEFRSEYELKAVPAMAAKTKAPIQATLNSVEEHINPELLRSFGPKQVTDWQDKLRQSGLAESTIRSYSTHLKAALNWAKSQGMLSTVPPVPMPKRARKSDGRTPMKGRPVTREEFDRMLSAVPKEIIDNRRRNLSEDEWTDEERERIASWKHLLGGLWWSGLRISEAMALTWDGDGLAVDTTEQHPMLIIDAESEKGHRHRWLPLAPEFAEFLLATPESGRVGFVFNPAHHWKDQPRASLDAVKRTIGRIGKAAGIKVLSGKYKGEPHTKYASAHDLRRAFGSRWAVRVMPAVLQQLMRHESIETTLRYYVGLDAAKTTEMLYEALSGNSSGNTTDQNEKTTHSESLQVVEQ